MHLHTYHNYTYIHIINKLLVTYSEEAVEVGKIKRMSDLCQDVQRQLPLIGRVAALVRRAAQRRHMPRM